MNAPAPHNSTSSSFDVSFQHSHPFCLESASMHGRDIRFEGVVLAEVNAGSYQYRLYHTTVTHPEAQLVAAKMRLQDGHVTAQVLTIQDTDVLEDFFTEKHEDDRLDLNVLHEICRQSRFPDYQLMGTWKKENAHESR
ncbi:hypothetical protein AAFX24_17875 [Vibrio mediterranei]|uniref:hypothetical protein n=1 Tax=Vibrio mediterranei TaxID=689 RepID=UPI0038CDD61A